MPNSSNLMAPAVDKILVVKLRAIGDVLLSTAVLPDLAAAYPQATLDFLTDRYCAGVLEGNPHVDTIHTFDARRDGGAELIRRIRKAGYDLVIDLFGNPRSALVTLFSGAKVRVGYSFNWRTVCYNRVVRPRSGSIHNVEFNLDALRRIGIEPAHRLPMFPLEEAAEVFAEKWFAENHLRGRRVVALNPGGGWISKKWRLRWYSALADMIVRELGLPVILLWGPGERQESEAVRDDMKESALLLPPTNLKQLASVLKRCSVLVTNDSGPMHIAAALGVPVTAIFGPTRPDLQGPVNTRSVVIRNERLDCLGCNYTECPIGNPCMEELTAEEVFSAFRTLYADVDTSRTP